LKFLSTHKAFRNQTYGINTSGKKQKTVILILLTLVLICFAGSFIALGMITAWAKMLSIYVSVMQFDVYWTMK